MTGTFQSGRLLIVHGQHHAERKHAVLRLETAQAPVTLGDGTDAMAAVAVIFPVGYGQTVPHGDFAGIGVPDLDEELIPSNAAGKVNPFERLLQRFNGMQRVFQTVGQHGAKLCIGDGELSGSYRRQGDCP